MDPIVGVFVLLFLLEIALGGGLYVVGGRLVRHDHPHEHPHDHPHDHDDAYALTGHEHRDDEGNLVYALPGHDHEGAYLSAAEPLNHFHPHEHTYRARGPIEGEGRGVLEPHEHRYDTMVGDGKGWRCGICGRLKEEG